MNIKLIIKSLVKSSGAIYALVAIFLFLIVDHELLKSWQVNYYREPIDYLVKFSRGEAEFDEEEFKLQKRYYDKIIAAMPKSPEGYAMLGFCQYYLGDIKRARRSYEQAVSLMEEFFWFHYNLGLIHYNEGDYLAARDSFQNAIMTDPIIAVKLLQQSMIYMNVSVSEYAEKGEGAEPTNPGILDTVDENIVDGFERAHQLMILCLEELKDYEFIALMAKKRKQESQRKYYGFYSLYMGIAAYHLGNIDAAQSFLRDSVKVDPYCWKTQYYIGLCLDSIGDWDRAQGFFDNAELLRSKPDPRSRACAVDQQLKVF